MSEPVRIVDLGPMRVAAVRAISPNPEEDARRALFSWAGQAGLLDGPVAPRVFGFDVEPAAPAGTEDRGYEVWMVVGPDVEPVGGVRLHEFGGGRYAVMRCPVEGDPWAIIPPAWERLNAWIAQQGYQMGAHQWLEEHLEHEAGPPAFVLDLYLPIGS
jgi:DNA gyrase inhibitor GyrI